MSGSKLPKESKSIPDKVSLPLEACIVGTELLESSSRSQYWLHFEYKSTMLTVTMGSNDTRKQLPLDQLDPKIHVSFRYVPPLISIDGFVEVYTCLRSESGREANCSHGHVGEQRQGKVEYTDVQSRK